MIRVDGVPVPVVSIWKPAPYFALAAPSAEPRSSRMASQSGDPGESSELAQKRSARKKHVTGVWPCKINGCNKQFAREADLKRHQRTTKMHSAPNFQCPQCDANFTRADALRRHQKSRHDGIMIMTPELGNDDDENRSRSGTPLSSKGKEREINIPVQTHQGVPSQSGPSSYYRSHTVILPPIVPPTQLDAAASSLSWTTYPNSWPNGTLAPAVGPIGYLPQHMYYPSPHYRPHTTEYPAPESPTYLKGFTPPTTEASSSSRASTSRNSSTQPPNPIAQQTTTTTIINNPLMDHGLGDRSELTEAEVLAAVQAVLMQAEAKDQREREEREEQERERREQRLQHGMNSEDSQRLENDDDHLSDSNAMDSMDLDNVVDGLHDYVSSPLERPEPMEHMLTEDGEPMLNPAELLTQESLASPPPS